MGRCERLGLTLTAREKLAVKRLADLEGGLSLAALVRRLVRREAQRQGLWSAVDGWRDVCGHQSPVMQRETSRREMSEEGQNAR